MHRHAHHHQHHHSSNSINQHSTYPQGHHRSASRSNQYRYAEDVSEAAPLTSRVAMHALHDDEVDAHTAPAKKSCWGCCSRLFASLHAAPSYRERLIYMGGGSGGDSAPSTPGATGVGASGSACSPPLSSFPANVVRNQKYHLLTFLPHFLYEQFKFFFNFYFLIVALSQFIPVLQIGFLFTYVAPLCFVLAVTMAKEAVDDLQRWRRDREANGQIYQRYRRQKVSSLSNGAYGGSSSSSSSDVECVLEDIPSSAIRVGDVLLLHTNQRVPADLVLLRTHDRSNGSIFIRTDQLDGETDWKLRVAVRATQDLPTDQDILLGLRAQVQVEAPKKEIYEFAANFTSYPSPPPPTHSHSLSSSASQRHQDLSAILQGALDDDLDALSSPVPVFPSPDSSSLSPISPAAAADPVTESLSLEHTLWANTVVASGTVVCLVTYTGSETRASLNANKPTTKTGRLDEELNRLSKLLFGMTVALALVMTVLDKTSGGGGMEGFRGGTWLLTLFRFILLFSSIIPISMRVNLDLSKTLYARLIESDSNIPDTLVRNSSIPEELGRVSFFFTDKTGTLTRNIMHFKCLQLEPPLFFTKHTLPKLRQILLNSFLRERRAREAAAATPHPAPIATLPPGVSSADELTEGAIMLSPIPLAASATASSSSSSPLPSGDERSTPRAGRSKRSSKAHHRIHSPSGNGVSAPANTMIDVALDGGGGGGGLGSDGVASPSTGQLHSTSRLARMSTRLQLEAEEAEEEESALARRVAGGDNVALAAVNAAAAAAAQAAHAHAFAAAEDESDLELSSEAGSFISDPVAAASALSSQQHRHKLAAAALTRKASPRTRGRRTAAGGYNNLADASMRHDDALELSPHHHHHHHGQMDDLDFDDEDEEGDIEMTRLESAKAAAAAAASSAATNATGRRLGASPKQLITSYAMPKPSPYGDDDDDHGGGVHGGMTMRSRGGGGGGGFNSGRSSRGSGRGPPSSRPDSPSQFDDDGDDSSGGGGGGGGGSGSSSGLMHLGGGVVGNLRVEGMVRALVTSLALCHNVTPVVDADTPNGPTVYQASSPDEVALVKFTESVGVKLVDRTQNSITIQTPLAAFDQAQGRGGILSPSAALASPSASSSSLSSASSSPTLGHLEHYDILHIFPFTSESKRMGILVRCRRTAAITFYLKGAESIMASKIAPSDWLEEEVDNLARVGLRTLVIAMKSLSEGEYIEFSRRILQAQSVITDRDNQVQVVLHALERNLTLLGLTGVEDKLQEAVKPTLETLRNAGIKVWMLTGDKAETATCIGISARLIDRNQTVFQLLNCTSTRETARMLDQFSTKVGACLVIDGPSLQICLDSFQKLFLELACTSPSVICCRCSPTQKATVVSLMRDHTKMRTCAIGDGGNDCSMILAADVGVGIVGKEGMQASLAADFSITQFSFVLPLLLWHGRNAYKRSARLSQFVIHRGLIISIIQAVFSALFFFAAIPIYNGWLMVGYATFYTMLPVFSLVLDEDVDEAKVYLYPELYRDLQKGRPLSSKTFFIWLFQSVYQGGIIMMGVLILFESKFLNIVAITFTSLIASELLNVALEIHTWHRIMVGAEVLSVVIYFASIFLLPAYFDTTFIFTWAFLWKVSLITTVSCLPPAIAKYLHDKFNPSAQSKVNES